MADWGKGELGQLVTITPKHILSLGPAFSTDAWASAVYVAANRAIFFPFRIPHPLLVVKLFAANGTVVSGNIDVGIYDVAGTRLVSSGSTLQAGISAIQEFNIADTLLGPGLFYLAVAMDNVTGTLFRGSSGGTAPVPLELLVTQGMAQQATAFPLPATATFAQVAQDYIPVIGLTTRVLI